MDGDKAVAAANESQSKPAPLDTPDRIDTYSEWLETQGIPIVRGFSIEDIEQIPLGYWDLKGIRASFVILDQAGGVNDAYIGEIPPGGKSRPIHHMYEKIIYVVRGHGATMVWQKDGRKHTFEWGPGSLFAIPLNAYYQHFNTSGFESVRFFAVTNCCFMMNLLHSVDYIFNNDYVFLDRFDPDADDYFSTEGKLTGRLFMTTNFIPDTRAVKLYSYDERGRGGTNIKFNMASQGMGALISEFPVGSYKKSHRHGPGANLIIISGKGFTLMWPSGPDKEPERVNWKPGTVVVPPDQWFHQHFNTGAERARYLAILPASWRYKPVLQGAGSNSKGRVSVKDGGNQIEYEDEESWIHRAFLDELKASGAKCTMCDYFTACPEKQSS